MNKQKLAMFQDVISRTLNEMAFKKEQLSDDAYIEPFSSAYLKIERDGKYNLIDKDGKYVSDVWFDGIEKTPTGEIKVKSTVYGEDNEWKIEDEKELEKVAVSYNASTELKDMLKKSYGTAFLKDINFIPAYTLSVPGTKQKVTIVAVVMYDGKELLLSDKGMLYNPDGTEYKVVSAPNAKKADKTVDTKSKDVIKIHQPIESDMVYVVNDNPGEIKYAEEIMSRKFNLPEGIERVGEHDIYMTVEMTPSVKKVFTNIGIDGVNEFESRGNAISTNADDMLIDFNISYRLGPEQAEYNSIINYLVEECNCHKCMVSPFDISEDMPPFDSKKFNAYKSFKIDAQMIAGLDLYDDIEHAVNCQEYVGLFIFDEDFENTWYMCYDDKTGTNSLYNVYKKNGMLMFEYDYRYYMSKYRLGLFVEDDIVRMCKAQNMTAAFYAAKEVENNNYIFDESLRVHDFLKHTITDMDILPVAANVHKLGVRMLFVDDVDKDGILHGAVNYKRIECAPDGLYDINQMKDNKVAAAIFKSFKDW